jgi:hypothetical protein
VDTNGVRQQLNTGTSGLFDLSIVYGLDNATLTRLSNADGSMKTETQLGGEFPPILTFGPTLSILEIADGFRGNQQNGLLSFHVLAVREHNHWHQQFSSGALKKKGKRGGSFTASELFHLARRMTIGVFQKIAVKEWFPTMTGIPASTFTGYEECDPSPIAEVMAMALRVMHSASRDHLKRLNKQGLPVQDTVGWRLELQDTQLRTEQMWNTTAGMAAFIRGMAATQAGKIDLIQIEGLRQLSFGNVDLLATDLKRGRDHGICDYADLRTQLGLSAPQNFSDVNQDYMEARYMLGQMYQTLNQVDAYSGMLAEDHVPGSVWGELAQVLLQQHYLHSIQYCDRFYFENPDLFTAISPRVDTDKIQSVLASQTLKKMLVRLTSIKNAKELERLVDPEATFKVHPTACIRKPV